LSYANLAWNSADMMPIYVILCAVAVLGAVAFARDRMKKNFYVSQRTVAEQKRESWK
jgi:hypothetical protein